MNQVKNLPLADTNALALEHLALYSTKVALARWGSGHTWNEMQMALALKPSCQTTWHNMAQDNFQSWLAAGGFASDIDALAQVQEHLFAGALESTHAQ